MEKRDAGLGGLRSAAAAPQDSAGNVITFRTPPPRQRINDFDPECTLAKLCGSTNSLAAVAAAAAGGEGGGGGGGTDEGDSYGG